MTIPGRAFVPTTRCHSAVVGCQLSVIDSVTGIPKSGCPRSRGVRDLGDLYMCPGLELRGPGAPTSPWVLQNLSPSSTFHRGLAADLRYAHRILPIWRTAWE